MKIITFKKKKNEVIKKRASNGNYMKLQKSFIFAKKNLKKIFER